MQLDMKEQIRLSFHRLAEALEWQQDLALQLGQAGLSVEQMGYLLGMRRDLLANGANLDEMDVLEQCDREESLAAWLETRQVPDPWEVAPLLLAAGADRATLLQLEENVGSQILPGALAWLKSNLATHELLQTLEQTVLRLGEEQR